MSRDDFQDQKLAQERLAHERAVGFGAGFGVGFLAGLAAASTIAAILWTLFGA